MVCCSHTRTCFDWGCWCCVVQGHYCCVGVLFSHQDTFVIGTAGGVLPKNIIVGVMCCSHIKTSFDGGMLVVCCPRHYCCGDVLISHQDIISLGLLVVCCSRALLLWWCVVLTPGHVLIGVVGGVLSKATTVVLVSCSHTRTLFDWSCWWCVVQSHYCCGDVLFSPPGHFCLGLLVVGCPNPPLL